MAESQTTREMRVRQRAVERNKLLKRSTQKTYIKPDDWGTPSVENMSNLENQEHAAADIETSELSTTQEERDQIRARQEAERAKAEAESKAADLEAQSGEETSPDDVSTSTERKGE